MANDRENTSVVAVVIVAWQAVESEELYAEEGGRWFELPQHSMPMAQPRRSAALTLVPVAALAVAE